MSRRQAAARRAQAKERRNREPGGGLSGQLRGRGLRIREVPGDGNCLFRALGDQLEGHSRNHLKHRQETVDYMIQQRRDFEPFVEDDVPFDRHVASLAKPGTFAGNDAIVAFARNHQVQVVIHQLNNPLWQIRGTDKADARELHIVYRYGEHYDSVRRLNDNSETPANLQTQMLCKDGSNKARNQLLSPGDKLEDGGDEDFQQELDEAVHKVRNATGCSDVNLILQNLEAESYDIESAVIAILQTEEYSRIDGEDESTKQQVQDQQTPTPALFEDCGSGTIVFGNQEIHQRKAENPIRKQKGQNLPGGNESQKSPPTSQENTANRNKPQKQPSNKQRKEQQRQEKKRRQEERHRQKGHHPRTKCCSDVEHCGCKCLENEPQVITGVFLVLPEMPSLLLVLLITCTAAPIWGSLLNFYFMILGVTRKNALLAYNKYGCHCGFGGRGQPIDPTDWCCHRHDCCYSELLAKGCKPYWDNYEFTLTRGNVTCRAKKVCGQLACECDRMAALCFDENSTYKKKNRVNRKAYCGGSIPPC